jgi:hypothetical protein
MLLADGVRHRRLSQLEMNDGAQFLLRLFSFCGGRRR